MRDKKDKYSQFIADHPHGSIFHAPWWLDAIAGDHGWDCVITEDKANNVIAAMPYPTQKRMGFFNISTPLPFTQTLGPVITDKGSNRYKKESDYKKTLFNLIDQMPDFDFINYKLSPYLQNWLPFHWRGFHQTTAYTYMLDITKSEDDLLKDMKGSIRTDLKKAEQQHNLNVEYSDDCDQLYDLFVKSYARQNRCPPYSRAILKSIHAACIDKQQGQIMIARDDQGQIHAGLFLVWDNTTTHYLVAGADPDFRHSAAQTYLLWQAIKYAKTKTPFFNFEGSMVEAIETHFRSFGGERVPYHRVYRYRSFLLKLHAVITGRL